MKRDKLIESLAQEFTDAMDLSSLIDFFYNEQVKYLDYFTDEQLLEKAHNAGLLIEEYYD